MNGCTNMLTALLVARSLLKLIAPHSFQNGLSHILKLAVREHADVKLLHVSSACEDTAVNFGPFVWERLALTRYIEEAPPLEGTPSIEQRARHLFNHYLLRAWIPSSYCPPLLSRFVDVDVEAVTVCTVSLALTRPPWPRSASCTSCSRSTCPRLRS